MNIQNNTKATEGSFLWESEVRGYELDIQGIVNNANYLRYFDHVRVKHLLSLGIDWAVWHQNGYDLVLTHVDMSIKSPLRVHDKFYITSEIELSGKIKILFHQKIFRIPDNKLIAEAINTGVCVSIKNSRPVMPDELKKLLFPEL